MPNAPTVAWWDLPACAVVLALAWLAVRGRRGRERREVARLADRRARDDARFNGSGR